MTAGAARNRRAGRGWRGFAALLVLLVMVAGCTGNGLSPGSLSPAATQDTPRAQMTTSGERVPTADPGGQADEAQLVPGQVVVVLREAEQLQEVVDELVGGEVRLVDTIPELRAAVLGVPDGREDAWISTLSADPRVLFAERNALLRALTVPDDPIYREFQWGLRKIGMEAVWDVTTGNPSVVVAVLDTGVDEAHPDLEPNVLPGFDYVNDDPDAWDDSSHGTHVAGVIAALGDNGEGTAGMAWRSKILPIKVLDSKGLGPDAAVSKGI